jgi:hypothetical protein
MKTFSTSGTGNQQTLSEIESDKMPIYDSLTDAEADLANLSVGQIIGITDTGDELAQPVDVVESGNLHAVSSNAVANAIGDKLHITTRALSSKSVNANSFVSYSFSNPHPEWTLLGAFIMSTGNQDANRQWGNVRSDQTSTIYCSIMSQITQNVSGKVVMLFLEA